MSPCSLITYRLNDAKHGVPEECKLLSDADVVSTRTDQIVTDNNPIKTSEVCERDHNTSLSQWVRQHTLQKANVQNPAIHFADFSSAKKAANHLHRQLYYSTSKLIIAGHIFTVEWKN